MTTRFLWLLACVGCAVDAGADDDGANDDRAADDGDDTSGAGGALLYEYAGEAVRFELATRTERTLGLQSGITERAGGMSGGRVAARSRTPTTGGTYDIAGYTLTLRYDDGRTITHSIIADTKDTKVIWIDGRGYTSR